MPNGGSDCCGSCWFNKKNQGEAGYAHASSREPDHCIVRDLAIPDAFYTYCANHPHRNPSKIQIPIGPVFVGEDREIWMASPDTEEVRAQLLQLLEQIPEVPEQEYPIGNYFDDIVIWQLGEFREKRAIADLEKILRFDPKKRSKYPPWRDRETTIELAKAALEKIREQE